MFLWLFPLKEIRPYLVSSYNKDSQVVKVEPLELNKESLATLMEIKCREFITDLHTFDGQTEMIRLKRLVAMASDEVIAFVENVLNVESQNSIAKKLQENNITRSVIVKHVHSLAPEAPNKWQVHWEMVESGEQAQKRTYHVSVVTAEAQAKTLSPEEVDINPIGFNVTAYSVRMVEND